MKISIIATSHRKNSESKRVSKIIEAKNGPFVSVEIDKVKYE